jgi:hypothetical protein
LTVNPPVLSPPNHDIIPVQVSGNVSDNCDPAPVMSIVSITCSEPAEPGEIEITGRLTANLAATRNPSGPGRVYTIYLQATDASGNRAGASLEVFVPKGNGNSGGTGKQG